MTPELIAKYYKAIVPLVVTAVVGVALIFGYDINALITALVTLVGVILSPKNQY